MKKVVLFSLLYILSSCAFKSEKIVGYNDKGKTLVEVCEFKGGEEKVAFNSNCVIDLRDYGNITNKKETIESMKFYKNTAFLIVVGILLFLA